MHKKKNLLIAGAGNIGCTIAAFFSQDTDYNIIITDQHDINLPKQIISKVSFIQCDVSKKTSLETLIHKYNIDGILSSLPYYCNQLLAKVAKETACHYFDLTEDVESTSRIFDLAKDAKTAFIPQCGVAPGYINIIANDLIQKKLQSDNTVNEVKLYCGALPQKNINALGYALTWSTDGLINEYGNMCRVLKNKEINAIDGLSELENLTLYNQPYEAFATSGGIGTLVDTYTNTINSMVYKTLRYPGHCEKIRFLMHDLKLNEDRKTLKNILENALPINEKDIVLVHVVVDDLSFTKQFLPTQIAGIECSAIQSITSISAATVIDTILSNPDKYQGAIKQESFSLADILSNPHAEYLK